MKARAEAIAERLYPYGRAAGLSDREARSWAVERARNLVGWVDGATPPEAVHESLSIRTRPDGSYLVEPLPGVPYEAAKAVLDFFR